MNDLQIFIYGGEQLRTIDREDGLWWVLRDVCRVLGLAEPHRVASRLDDDEKGRTQMTPPGGMQEVTIINEPGLYAVILRSDKPEAKQFKRWVTHEVLPSIRKKGRYGGASPEQLSRLTDAQEAVYEWRKIVADFEKLTADACKANDAARRRYDDLRRRRDSCREHLRIAQSLVDDLIAQIALIERRV